SYAHHSYGRVRQMFFGRAENVETARWVFTSLMTAVDHLWAEYRIASGAPGSDRKAYRVGVLEGFASKLHDQRRAMEAERGAAGGPDVGAALATIGDGLAAAFADAPPNMRAGRFRGGPSGSHAAARAGRAAGRNLNLSRPIAGRGPKGLPGK